MWARRWGGRGPGLSREWECRRTCKEKCEAEVLRAWDISSDVELLLIEAERDDDACAQGASGKDLAESILAAARLSPLSAPHPVALPAIAKCLILGLVLLALGCRAGGEEEDQGSPAPQRIDQRGRVVLSQQERAAVGLETAVIAEGTLSTNALRFGRVVGRPQEDALVTAPVTARLMAPSVSLGASVAAGDVLVSLEPLVDTASRATLEVQRRELLGQVEGARAQVQARQADLSRVATLVSSGMATEADRAKAQAELTSEQARLESLRRAGSELARMTGGRMQLRAPVAGVVVALATDAGSTIQPGTVVARVVQAGPRWVDVAVPPDDPIGTGYSARGVDGPVALSLLARGAVVELDGTRRDRLEAGADVAGSLLPGEAVPVEVIHESKGLIVPVGAVVRRGRETIAFVESEEGRFEPRVVQVAARDDKRAVAAKGLAAGDRVVTQGASSLLGELGAAAPGPGSGAEP